MPPTELRVEDVIELVEDQLGKKAPPGGITPDSSLEDAGLSSLDVAEIFFELEELAGIELDTSASSATTTRELVELINVNVQRSNGGTR
jgi:acyl carrier protein